MAKINPNAAQLIDNYLISKEPFANEINSILRELIHKAFPEVVEDWKWGTPVFQRNELVCGFAGFKKHVSLHFFKGAYMSDRHGLFTDDCSAQHSRTIKYASKKDIDTNKLTDYLKEAFDQSGVPLKKATAVKKEFVVPELLLQALDKNTLAKKNFKNMANTYRKEYAQHISDAKRESTRLRRLEKVIQNLENNIKMHEQYKC